MSSIPPPEYTLSIMSSVPPPPYTSSPVGLPSPPQYTSPAINLITPLSYRYRSIYGISPEVDEWITGTAPEPYLLSCTKLSHLTNTANMYKSKLTPLAMTRTALQLILPSREHDWPDNECLRKLGLKSLPAAFFHDIVKPPYHLARLAITFSQSRHECKKMEKNIEDEILESLSISLEVLQKILVRLGLETPETLKRQMQGTDFYLFLTLARFLEAYGSRFAPPGVIYLASRRRLPKEHCSGFARRHFDQIHGLKDDLIFLPGPFMAIEQWLPCVLQALKGLFVDWDENNLFNYVLRRLCQTRDELPRLILRATRE